MVLVELTPSKLNRTQNSDNSSCESPAKSSSSRGSKSSKGNKENHASNNWLESPAKPSSSWGSKSSNGNKDNRANYTDDLDRVRKNWLGVTPLHVAARSGFVNKAKKLIDKGVDMNAATNQDYTPLHYAAMSGRTNMARVLITKGRELGRNDLIDAKNANEWTPLHVACANGRTDTAILLIEMGASVAALDAEGRTALQLVRKYRPSLTEVLGREPAAVYVPSLQNEDYFQYEEDEEKVSEKKMAKNDKKKKKSKKDKKGKKCSSQSQSRSIMGGNSGNSSVDVGVDKSSSSRRRGGDIDTRFNTYTCGNNSNYTYTGAPPQSAFSESEDGAYNNDTQPQPQVYRYQGPSTQTERELDGDTYNDNDTDNGNNTSLDTLDTLDTGTDTASSSACSSRSHFVLPPPRRDVQLSQHGEFPLSKNRVLTQHVQAGIVRFDLWNRRKGFVSLLRLLQSAQRKYLDDCLEAAMAKEKEKADNGETTEEHEEVIATISQQHQEEKEEEEIKENKVLDTEDGYRLRYRKHTMSHKYKRREPVLNHKVLRRIKKEDEIEIGPSYEDKPEEAQAKLLQKTREDIKRLKLRNGSGSFVYAYAYAYYYYYYYYT